MRATIAGAFSSPMLTASSRPRSRPTSSWGVANGRMPEGGGRGSRGGIDGGGGIAAAAGGGGGGAGGAQCRRGRGGGGERGRRGRRLGRDRGRQRPQGQDQRQGQSEALPHHAG